MHTHDILSKFLNLLNECGKELDFHVPDMTIKLWSLVWHRSDTTAISLANIFYTLMKHQTARVNELENAFTSGHLSKPVLYNNAPQGSLRAQSARMEAACWLFKCAEDCSGQIEAALAVEVSHMNSTKDVPIYLEEVFFQT